MSKKTVQRLFSALLAAIFLCSIPVPAFAAYQAGVGLRGVNSGSIEPQVPLTEAEMDALLARLSEPYRMQPPTAGEPAPAAFAPRAAAVQAAAAPQTDARFRLYPLAQMQGGTVAVNGLFVGGDVRDQTDPATGAVTGRFARLDYTLEGGAPALQKSLTAVGSYQYPNSAGFGSDQYAAATDNWQSELFTGFQDGVLYHFTLNWQYQPSAQNDLPAAMPPQASGSPEPESPPVPGPAW